MSLNDITEITSYVVASQNRKQQLEQEIEQIQLKIRQQEEGLEKEVQDSFNFARVRDEYVKKMAASAETTTLASQEFRELVAHEGLKQEIKSFDERVANYVQEKAELDGDIAAIEDLLSNIERTLATSVEEARVLDEKMADQTQVIESLQGDTVHSLARFHGLKAELEREASAMDELKDSLAIKRAQLSEIRELQAQSDEQMRAKSTATEQLAKTRDAVKNATQQFEATLHANTMELKQCEEEKQKMASLVVAKEAELEMVLKEVADDAEKIQLLKAVIPAKTQQIEQVQADTHKLRSTIVAFAVEINAAKREIQRAEHLYSQRRAPDEQIKQELLRLQELYPKLQEELTKAQRTAAGDDDDNSEFALLTKELQAAQATRGQLAGHIDATENNIQAYQTDIAANRSKTEEITEQARKSQRDGVQLREQAEALEASVDATQQQLQQLKHSEQELEQKREQLTAAETELHHTQQEIAAMRSNNDRLRAGIARGEAVKQQQALQQENVKEKRIEHAKRALITQQRQKIAELRKQLEQEDQAFREAFQTCEQQFGSLKAQLVAELEVLEEAQVARPLASPSPPLVGRGRGGRASKQARQARQAQRANDDENVTPSRTGYVNKENAEATPKAKAARGPSQLSRPPLRPVTVDEALDDVFPMLSQPRSYSRKSRDRKSRY